MDLGIAIGSLVATRKVPSLEGVKFCWVQPIDENGTAVGAPLIATDQTGQIGDGEIVYFVRGGDATQLAAGVRTPSDAAIVGIVDHLDSVVLPDLPPPRPIR